MISGVSFTEFLDRLKMLGLSQRRFAAFIGLTPTAVGRWRQNGVPIYACRIVQLLQARVDFGNLRLAGL